VFSLFPEPAEFSCRQPYAIITPFCNIIMSASSSGLSDGVKRKMAVYFVIIHVVGLLLSIQLTANHFGGTTPQICEFGKYVSCRTVQKSPWAFFLGVPLAYFGIVYFLLGLCMGIFLASPRTDDGEIAAGLVALVVIGLVSVVYFVVGEYSLGAICPLCTAVHILIVASLFFALKIRAIRNPTWSLMPMSLFRLAWDLRTWVLIGILLVGVPIVSVHLLRAEESSPYSDEQLVEFGKCLASRRMTLYSAKGCTHCLNQKKLLGAGLQHVPLVECESADDEKCKRANISAFPTWVKIARSGYESDQTRKGVMDIEELARFTSCTIKSKDEL
jgi:uncharacterized membrane protein